MGLRTTGVTVAAFGLERKRGATWLAVFGSAASPESNQRVFVCTGNGRVVASDVCSILVTFCSPFTASGSSVCAATIAIFVTITTLCAATISLIWHRRRAVLSFCGQDWIQPERARVTTPSAIPTQIPEPHGSRRVSLPIELIEHIADHLFEIMPPVPDYKGDAPMIHSKPSWADVGGFMTANLALHNLGFVRWLRVITVMNTDDWGVILQYSQFVREIRCLDRALSDTAHQHALAQLPNLVAAIIDAHSDVWHNEDHIFTYRDVIAAFPPSLKRLEVINAHGPDVKIIATVKKYCPKIEELRFGRCTMFNRMPACHFWRTFPHDHDAYIAVEGMESYAHSLGGELFPLKNLRSLRMGLYLAPSDIVLAHRLYHRYGRVAPEPIDWQTAIPLSELLANPFIEPENLEPATTEQLISILHQQDSKPGEAFDCHLCVDMTAEISRIAETTANGILQEHVPSLGTVEWMGWLTPGHLGVHSFELSA